MALRMALRTRFRTVRMASGCEARYSSTDSKRVLAIGRYLDDCCHEGTTASIGFARSAHSVALGVAALQFEPEPRPRRVGRQRARARLGRAVEEHRLDAGVVVEPLEVPHRPERAPERSVQ